MHRHQAWVGIAFSAALLLPAPGTDSKSREFCRDWLALPKTEKQTTLLEAEARERTETSDPECRAGRRAGLRHKLDAECRNWPRLMDFEVRMIVDAVLEPCAPEVR